MTTRRLHRYHGHRRNSFICADVDELVELRAHQRTYNGAYVRTALGILGFALAVLRLFDRKFYRNTGDTANIPTIRTVGQDHKQLFGRPFVTAGRIVALVACVVAATEIVLLALVLWL
ncbi:hypothetical protein BGY98DRAFT_1092125 [Russula aff. rugulosa BPL654]|nr:hypothetical protein BGY98DRAFT_1092125 [Russula aff. rugulosa BPL654]